MRSTFKIINRLDSFYTMMLVLPALFIMAHAGMQYHNGNMSQAQFSTQSVASAKMAATQAVSNYKPMIETTGRTIAAGVTKMASAASGCFGKSTSRVIHLNAASGKCGGGALKGLNSSFGGPKPIHIRR